ncbi:dTDP-4-dehydrorhamnose reductase [Paraliobacillus salinarum]|uniref:dTDP-4-dehydrorhamnose reductase n=1 Tax=Paraliobacillus salinarum TaxID=1158996 RepID=UPI0015F66120|nr:dTDP-4-dehydrorhamnose reductase [Paraliobacillus salinarum]
MKVLVTGANGQLGYDVLKRLEYEGIEYLGADRELLDITNEEHVKRIIGDYYPDVVIHCAAYTWVDRAEDEKDLCYSVNVLGTKYVAEACKNINAKMVYISTDYVFDGVGETPFGITHKPNPINYYGETKYKGELEVLNILKNYFIVRISWVFGNHGNNFVKTMLKLAKERDEISVVVDQFGSPTYTYDLAESLVEMIQSDKFGIYHVTNEGFCNWYEFACEIFKQAGLDIIVNPIKTEEYPTKAKRPKNSRLNKTQNIGSEITHLRSWQEALKNMINNEMR